MAAGTPHVVLFISALTQICAIVSCPVREDGSQSALCPIYSPLSLTGYGLFEAAFASKAAAFMMEVSPSVPEGGIFTLAVITSAVKVITFVPEVTTFTLEVTTSMTEVITSAVKVTTFTPAVITSTVEVTTFVLKVTTSVPKGGTYTVKRVPFTFYLCAADTCVILPYGHSINSVNGMVLLPFTMGLEFTT